ncbi:MAG: hypothetical protein NVS2B17_07370 [Candidatus Velthaea sp.]
MMNFAVSLIGAAVVGVAAHAPPSDANVPIQVTACAIQAGQTFRVGPEDMMTSFVLPATVTVSFVNRAAMPAAQIAFGLVDRDRTQIFVDKGSFAPGAPVTHSFSIEAPVASEAPTQCPVSAVTFSDGSRLIVK